MAKKKTYTLEEMIGLAPDEFVEVLAENPRAYMAVRGAVAERHLAHVLEHLVSSGQIKEYGTASSDFDKDFEVVTKQGNKVVVECKNAQVLNLGTKTLQAKYLDFLMEEGRITQKPKEFKKLAQKFRESGVDRYCFSESFLKTTQVPKEGDCSAWLKTVEKASVDFQRTRNSTASSGKQVDPKALRFYQHGELDVLAVCMFARTLKWEFVFTTKNGGAMKSHNKFKDRYANSLKLTEGVWYSDLMSALQELGL